MSDSRANAHLTAWKQKEGLAEALVPLVGGLYREHALVVAVFGTSLVGKTPVQMLSIFREAAVYAGQELSLRDAVSLLELMNNLELGRARVDIGKLLVRYAQSGLESLDEWAVDAFAPLVSSPKGMPEKAQDVVLYGFGRIGRLMARILIGKTGGGDKYRLRAIVLRPMKSAGDLDRRASLLATDSVHGPFNGTIEVDHENKAIIANGNMIHIIEANTPEEADYASYGIENAVVIDNTGIWRDREALSRHLKAPGVAKVILTAPGKGVPNIVYGVNHRDIDPNETVFSAASCTTNAITPVLAVLDQAYGIKRGHLETIHAYTNDQNLIDNFHKKDRRGRAAALNMVITSTGAASAVSKALPGLAGKLTGSAIRVPTPNVSLAILNLELDTEVSRDDLNEFLRKVAADSPLSAQIDYSVSPEAVSSDLVGDHHAGTVDSLATIAGNGNAVLYVWYDNEYGYSCQVMRLLQEIADVSPVLFPEPAPFPTA
ncbi:MAG: glyceraldehyde-3-phosphate dehydrogenase [Deltaproteobacteria bacterium]|nr:MAG: glyceraldehyde-3-phosphate dehydrogenase [Deltaproteobacteria bacterium]